MGYRRILIEKDAVLTIRHSRLTIQTESQSGSFPLEDVDALLIESPQVHLSASTLSSLAEHGCAVYFCDRKHLPCCMLLPYLQHSRELNVLKHQLALSEPRRKRLWQSIVEQKIQNQSLCLSLIGQEDGAGKLRQMAARVLSGDSTNVEAAAAACYFPQLFGEGFFRGNDQDGRNAALNYGYAILRGAIARSLAVYGFQSCLGLHHHNELNGYNLADDLIEPFRPVTDLLVVQTVNAEDALSAETKHNAFDLLSSEVLVHGKHYSVSYAIELAVQSLGRCLKDPSQGLSLPTLTERRPHRYE